LDEAEANTPQDFFPDHAYFIYVMVRTCTSVKKCRGTDLISKGQEVVVDPQAVHGNHKQLGGVAHKSIFTPSPYVLEA